jgi:SAM-dependent methyltransferase
LPSIVDLDCGGVFLNQELGDWTHSRIPRAPRVWVAGCGTNQALLTALRFPDGDVFGSDISTESLAICRETASQLGIKNLRLEEQSLNAADFSDEFDYIICTGVIHHNADPRISLAKLAAALKPSGILETMVYNYYHRILPTAYQKAIRWLCRSAGANDLDFELRLTKELIDRFPLENSMGDFLAELRHEPEVMIADLLLQPIEHTYTIESWGTLLDHAGLEYWLPCMNQFDRVAGNLSWDIEFTNQELARHYDSLPDVERWQIANLLLVESSPMIWFYTQRKDASFKRKSETEVCNDFLSTRFRKYQTTARNYVNEDGRYRILANPIPHPSPPKPVHETARRIFEAVNPEKTIGEVLEELQVEPSFHLLNQIRMQLTTALFPYLRAVSAPGPSQVFVHTE